MSLTRFTPQMALSFFLLVERPGALARLGAAWFALALAAQLGVGSGQQGIALAAVLVQALAVGAFGFQVQRFVALGETRFAQPPRAVAWALAFLLLRTAEMAPQPLILQWVAGDPNAAIYALVGKQAFQILFGGFFLILPAIALAAKGDGGPGPFEAVMKGGLAAGFGYVLVSLPFVVATHLWGEASPGLPMAVTAPVATLLTIAETAVVAGYFARLWGVLRG